MGERPDGWLAAWRAFLRAHAEVVARLDRELRSEHGLPLTWYEVLLHLGRAPEGRLRMSELASSVLLSRSGVTRLVDRLEAEGLVERRSCPTDRRGWLAAVTPAGQAALRRAAPTHLQGVQRHFADHLSAEEAEALAAALGRVAEAAGRGGGGSAPDGDA